MQGIAYDNDGGITLKNLTALNQVTVPSGGLTIGSTAMTATAAQLNAAATAVAGSVVDYPIRLQDFVPVTAVKDALADTPDGTTLGLADTAAAALTGSTTNSGGTNSVTETASADFVLPETYSAGAALTLRIRAKVSVARTTAQTVDAFVKLIGDAALGSDICATNAQTITASYANYDFTITPTGLVPGSILNVALSVLNTAGVATDGLITITRVSLRPTIIT